MVAPFQLMMPIGTWVGNTCSCLSKGGHWDSAEDLAVHYMGLVSWQKVQKTLNNGCILEIIQMMSQVDDVGDIYERCQHDSDVMALNEYCCPITMHTLCTRVRGLGTTTITLIEVRAMDMIDKQSYLLDTCNNSNASHPKTI